MIISKDLMVLGDYLRLPKTGDHSSIRCDSRRDYDNSCELTFTSLRTSPVRGSSFALSDVSGEVKPGEMLAVMGSTGCGKTSLLTALSGRLTRGRLESGEIRLNGEKLCKRLRRTKIGYVLQHDIFFADLTLKQTLMYTALLRLPDHKFSEAEKLEKVDEIIDVLDLRRCQDTIIGDVMKRGLSGGEKKRLSIACELITNPSVLLIDEPTSGLDSCTATNLMTMLKEYAQKESKSVVLAVHQPSSKIFHLFDRLLLLCDGQTAYFGEASHVISHFSSLGLDIAPNYNPADFVLEQLKSSSPLILSSWNKHVHAFESLEISSATTDLSDFNELRRSNDSLTATWPTSFCSQIRVLAARNFREARPRMLSKLNWFQTLALAIMAGLVWFQTERREETLNDLDGWMFFSSTYWMLFALFGALASFPGERAVVEKERLSGAYRLSAYYIAKMIGEAPLVMVLPSVYLIVAYPLLGGSFAAFFGVLLIQILSSLAAQSAGLFFGAALDLSASITVAALFTLAAQLLGGYLANNIPPYLKTVSLVYHALRNMQIFEYSFGEPIRCATGVSKFESCNTNLTALMTDGDTVTNIGYIPREEILNSDSLSTVLPVWTHSLFLIAFFFIFRLLGYVALRRSL